MLFIVFPSNHTLLYILYGLSFRIILLIFEVKRQLATSKKIIAHPVVWRHPVKTYRLTVLLRWVTFVALPVVLWKLLGKGVHIVVTICLCKNTCCGDGEIFAVAFHYGCVRQVFIWLESVSVNDNRLRTGLQLVKSTVHGKEACVKDVYLVNLLRSDDAHGPMPRRPSQ